MKADLSRVPTRVRVYLSSRQARDRVIRALSACSDGVWLGLLSREHLHALDESFYDSRREEVDGRVYSYFDEDYNTGGLADWEAAAVREYFAPGSRVIVTGAGGGREVLALLESGFDAMGYEPHPRFAAAGAELLRHRGHEGRLAPSERDAFPAEAGTGDAVVVGWGSYMLIAGRTRRVEFLQEARSRLKVGDPILLSFYATATRPRYLSLVARIANPLRRLRRAEPVEPGDTLVPNFVHYFTQDEVVDELRAGGFDFEAFVGAPYPHAIGRAAA